MQKLPRIVAETKVGKAATIDYWRNGKRLTTNVTLGELDESDEYADAKKAMPKKDMPKEVKTKEIGGLELATINEAMRKKYRLPKELSGVLVVNVKPNSKMAKQNIRIGDIIVQVNGKETVSIPQVEASFNAAKKAGREFALVRMIRDKAELFITLPTGQ